MGNSIENNILATVYNETTKIGSKMRMAIYSIAMQAAETAIGTISQSERFERRVLEIVFGANSSATTREWHDKWMLKFIETCPCYEKSEPTRSGQPWTDGEVAQLEREVSKLVSKLAGMYGRTPKAIESKCRALGLLGYKH